MTESWSDHRPRWVAAVAGGIMGISDLRAHNEQNIRTTLANLEAVATQR